MSEFAIIDTGNELFGKNSAHRVEAKKGFTTCASLVVEKVGNEYYVCSLDTKLQYRKKGLARQLLAHIEENYGPVVIKSANDPFWEAIGFEKCQDNFWRKKKVQSSAQSEKAETVRSRRLVRNVR